MNSFRILLFEILSFVDAPIYISASGQIDCVPVSTGAYNLSCYQCIKNTNEECGPEHLLPCPKAADRCVTHISKYVDKGYLIKRECGLGPCEFEDDMANKGLGMYECDRSKDEYFCVTCCKTSGCNQSGSTAITSSAWLIFTVTIFLLFTFKMSKMFF